MLRSSKSKFKVPSLFLMGPEHPLKWSYFAVVHNRQVNFGVCIVEAAIQNSHCGYEIPATDLIRSHRQLQHVDDDPDGLLIHQKARRSGSIRGGRTTCTLNFQPLALNREFDVTDDETRRERPLIETWPLR